MARYLAALDTDHAQFENAQGYSKADQSVGHGAAILPLDSWDDEIVWAIYECMRKYQTQLAAGGFDFKAIPEPPKADRLVTVSDDYGFRTTLAGRDTLSNAARKMRSASKAEKKTAEAKAAATIKFEGGQFAIAFPYSDELVTAVRNIPGRHWNGATKTWTAPLTSAQQVLQFAKAHDITVDNNVAALVKPFDKVVAPKDKLDVGEHGFTIKFVNINKKDSLKALGIGAYFDSKTYLWLIAKGLTEAIRLRDWADKNEVEISDDAVKLIDSIAGEHEKAIAASKALDADIDIDLPEGLSFYGYQRAGVKYALDKKRTWIADSPGLGKSLEASAAVILGEALPCLVVCPVNVLMNWPAELAKFFPSKSVCVIQGTARAVIMPGFDFYIVGYSTIGSRWEDFMPLELRGLIVDESHRIKNGDRKAVCPQCGKSVHHAAKSCQECGIHFETPDHTWSVKQTNGVLHIGQQIADDGMILLLSGTPLKNGRAKELVNQLEVLRVLDSDFGGRSRFLAKWGMGHTNSAGYWQADGLANPEQLGEKLRAVCMIRRRHADVDKDLPALVHNPVWLSVAPAKLAEYRKVEADTITYIADRAKQLAEEAGEDGTAAAWEARLRAEAAEHLVTLNALRRAVVEAKIDAVHEWVESFHNDDEDAKLLIFGWHTDVVEGLHKSLSNSVMIKGGVKADDRYDIAQKFQTDPICKDFVGNLAAASEGLTLTAAYDAAIVELDWTPASFDQCLGRGYGRANDSHGMTGHYMLLQDTVDSDMMAMLLTKRDKNGKVLDGGGSMGGSQSVVGDLLVKLAKRGMGTQEVVAEAVALDFSDAQ